MPEILISKDIDAAFLAKLANLGPTWGTVDVDNNQQRFAFMTPSMDAVEQALEDYPAEYLAYKKSQKLETLANVRRSKEILGPMGLVLDATTIGRLTAAAVGLMLDTARTSIRWEVTRGQFADLPREQVLGLAVLSVNHVQACFDNVSDKTDLINAVALGTEEDALATALAELAAIDLTTGWPS